MREIRTSGSMSGDGNWSTAAFVRHRRSKGLATDTRFRGLNVRQFHHSGPANLVLPVDVCRILTMLIANAFCAVRQVGTRLMTANIPLPSVQ
jgi:hypothetical protein